MGFILVCATDSSCRRLYVDNLVLRGYVTVGTASLDEARKLLQRETPQLILICALRQGEESVVESLRMISALDQVPVIVVSAETLDREWIKTWGVEACLPYPLDLRKLVPSLLPWLNERAEKPALSPSFMPMVNTTTPPFGAPTPGNPMMGSASS